MELEQSQTDSRKTEHSNVSLLETIVNKFNAVRFDLRNITVLYALPEKVKPLTKWALNEITSVINYGRGDMPLTVAVETISRCNRKCGYCPMGSKEFLQSRQTRIMSDETYEEIVDNLESIPRLGGKKGFNGALILNDYGEPMLDPKFVARAKYARQHLPDARIGLFSNGDYFSEEKYNQLKDAGVNTIVLTPHDGIFRKELTDIYEKHKQDGILRLNKPLTQFQNRGGKVAIPKEKLIAPDKRCISPTYSVVFATDGQIAICCNDATMETSQGNINDTPLMEVWDDPHYKELRDSLRHGNLDKIPDICKRCRQPSDLPTTTDQ
jgi:2-deoxy-scyllo-inosamine dehydrogenase (SAM-dependent)